MTPDPRAIPAPAVHGGDGWLEFGRVRSGRGPPVRFARPAERPLEAASGLDLDPSHRMRAAGEDPAVGDVLVGDAAVVHHMHLARQILVLQVPQTPKLQPEGMLSPACREIASTVSASVQGIDLPLTENTTSDAASALGTTSSSTGASAGVSTGAVKVS